MNEKTIIQLTNPDGSPVEAEVLLFFKLVEGGRDYIIYTFNDPDANGMVTIHTSILTKKDSGYVLENIEDADEWAKIKDVMRQVITENRE